MKKILVIFIITISSIFSFSAKSMEKKKLGGKVKLMLHGGYDLFKDPNFLLSAEIGAYKKFEVKKINTIFNVGGGIDFSNYFNDIEYVAIIRPYFSTEIAGYVSKDIRMFTDIKLGVGAFIRESFVETFPKASVSLGMTYKERFTVELAYNLPVTISLGFGARFGF